MDVEDAGFGQTLFAHANLHVSSCWATQFPTYSESSLRVRTGAAVSIFRDLNSNGQNTNVA